MNVLDDVSNVLNRITDAEHLDAPAAREQHEWFPVETNNEARESYECVKCGKRVSMRTGGAALALPLITASEECGD